MSVGESLDQSLQQIEERLLKLEEMCQLLKEENAQLRKQIRRPQRTKTLSAKKVNPEETEKPSAPDKIEHPKLDDHQPKTQAKKQEAEAEEIYQPVSLPVGIGVIYAVAESNGDGLVSLIDAGIEYKDSAICLLQDMGNDEAVVYFNPDCKEQALPNLESHVMPYFDCEIKSGNNIPSSITCMIQGMAKRVGEGRWELIKKAKIVIS